MTYKVFVHNRVVKFLDNLPSSEKKKIKDLLFALKSPYKCSILKVKGKSNVFRVRVGKYRILLLIDDSKKVVAVIKIDKRSRVYKNLL